jgi:DNA-directed RNA polymerase specialized sigma24 family protein
VLDLAVRRLSEKASVDNVRAFTYGIARKVLLNLRKKRARQRRALADLLRQLREQPDGYQVEARYDCLERCLAEYPDDQGQIILRCFKIPWGGRRELAEELRTTPEDLAQLIFKAKPKLRECIEKCLGRHLLK